LDNLFISVKDIVNSFGREFPVYWESLLILIIGLVIAKLAYLAIAGVLKIAKFDAAAEKIGVLDLLKNHITDIPSRIIANICYWIIITLTLCAIVGNFGFGDISIILWSIIKLFSQIISFTAFLAINFYILKFFAKIFSIALSLINFNYYRVFEIFIYIIGGYGIIYYSLPLLSFDESAFLTATFFVLKCITVAAVIIIVIGCRDIAYNIYLHFLIKSVYKIGNHIIINDKEYVINKLRLFSIVLLHPEAEIIMDNKKFYENIIKKR